MAKKLNLKLAGREGNTFALIAYFSKEARKAGWSEGEIEEIKEDASSSDYQYLLKVLMEV